MSNAPALRRDQNGRAYIRVSEKVADLIAGETDLSAWDDEEVLRGQAKSRRGKFEGRPPTVVPRAVYAEFARRQMEAGFAELIGDLPELLRAVLAIAKDPSVDENTRLRAADMALDRILGRPRERVDLDVGLAPERPRYEAMLEAVSIRRNADDWDELDSEVVDAEVVEDPWGTLDEWGD